LDEIHDLVEMRMMVASLSDEWKAEARRVGLQEGRQQGLQEGELTLLLRLLRKRFGELPEWVRARLEQASIEQLEHWGEQLLQADSLEALFDGHEPAR
jgi:predicted transposase YdaD